VVTRRSHALLVAIACITVSTARVAAQRADDEAKREYQIGYRALQRGDCTEALVHYRRSLELSPRPRTLFNIAVCEETLGRKSEAWRSYRAFLQIAEERDASIVDAANARIAALTAELRGTVTIESSPPGASVRVDDERQTRGTTPITLSLEPGTHAIRVTLSAAAPVERTVDVVPGELTMLSVSLELPSSSTDDAAPPGATDSDAPHPSVSIDGAETPVTRTSTTAVSVPVSSGTHEIVVTAPGGLVWRHTLELAADERLTVELTSARPSSRRRMVAWGLGGLGAAGIAGGAVCGVLALRDVTDASGGDHDRGKRRALAADGLIAVGTVAVIAAWRLLRQRSPSVTISRGGR
jgi:hypothetical protein